MKYVLLGSVLACASIAACGSEESDGGGAGGGSASSGSNASGGGGATGGSGGGAGTASGTGGGTGATGGSGATGGGGTSATGGTGATGGGFGSDDQCVDAPTQIECANCCDNTHPEGREARNRITADCVCRQEHCGTECADTACANPFVQPAAGSACETCFTQAIDPANTSGCADEIVNACIADADCSAPFDCFDARGCASKP